MIDASERTAQASISIDVIEDNTAPSVEITSPGAFESFTFGSDLTLVGGASDPNHSPDELVAVWTFEPELGGPATEIETTMPTTTGTVLSTWFAPPIGEHRLRLVVTDPDGEQAEAQVVINVEDPYADDADQDNWTVGQGDCDDDNPDVNPAASELCNGIDDDCNGEIDDKDADGDEHVDEACVQNTSPWPADDCDDTDPTTYLGAPEQADGADNDCNGQIDDGLSNFDNDGDCACTAATCIGSIDPTCVDLVTGDCDDTDPLLNPYDDDLDGYSTCDGDCDDDDDGLNLDDNDGDTDTTCATDCDDGDSLLNGLDVDGDGFSSCDGDCNDGDASALPLDLDGDGSTSCTGDCNDSDPLLNGHDLDGDGFTTCTGDCDDDDPLLTPLDEDGDGATSCDGDCDDDNAAMNLLDGDLDGYSSCAGDCNDASALLTPRDFDGDGYSSCQGDCDDSTTALSPIDNDGDGYSTCTLDCDDDDATLDPADVDGDGYSTCDGDCDDDDPSLDPGDADGDTYSTCDGDCDDSLSVSHPGLTEIPYNGIDDDCVGGDLVDVDGDGFPAIIAGGTDCDDDNFSVKPTATESCSTTYDDDCDGSINENGATGCVDRFTDDDGDGWGVGTAFCTCDAAAGATQLGDCYDDNDDAHPDQIEYFQDDRGDGSWDYDCDGSEDKKWLGGGYECEYADYFLGVPTSCDVTAGWLGGSAPDCGTSDEWNYGCSLILLPVQQCNPHSTANDIYDQECR